MEIQVNITKMEYLAALKTIPEFSTLEPSGDYWVVISYSAFLKELERFGLPTSLEGELTKKI